MVVSAIGTNNSDMSANTGLMNIDRAKFGSIYSMWFYDKDYSLSASAVLLKDTAYDSVVLCGGHKSWGTCVHWTLTASANATTPALLATSAATIWTSGGNVTSD